MNVKRKTIKYDIGLVPAGTYEIPDWQTIRYDKTKQCSISINIPDTAKVLNLKGKWQRITLSLRNQEYVSTIDFLGEISEKIQKSVRLYVCYDGQLAEGLTPVLIGNDISSAEVAKNIAEQAGITLFWDNRLNYNVVTPINPVEDFIGTFRSALEKLLLPFNQEGIRTADIFITKNSVIVRHANSTDSVYNLQFGDGFWLKNLTVVKKQPPRIRDLYVQVHIPKPLEPETKREVEEQKNEQGKVVSRIIRLTTSQAGFVLQEEEEYFGKVYYRESDFSLHWKLGMTKRKITTFEYDPPITDVNKYFIRNRKLIRKRIEESIYVNQELQQTNIEDTTYSYDGDELTQEVVTKAIDMPAHPEQAIIYEKHTEYTRVSDDITRVSTTEVHWTVIYEYEGGEWKKVSQIAYERQDTERTILSPVPNVPSLPFIFDEDRVQTITNIIHIGEEGEDFQVEFFGESPDLSALITRLTKCKYEVTIQGPGQYDIEPGTDIELSIPEGVCLNKQQEPGEPEQEIDLHDILSSLPKLRVTSVDVTMEKYGDGTQLLSTITAEGYGD